MLQTQTTPTPSALLTSALTPYSGDLQNLLKVNIELPALSWLNTDSESSTKKGKIGVVGDLLMEVLRKKNCYVFLTYYCAHNGLSLGPSFLLRYPLLSRTDYDSYTSVDDSLLVHLLVVSGL
jgi:hypothetical protein